MLTFYPTISRGEAGKYLDGTTTRVLLTASSYAASEVKKYGIVRNAICVPHLPDSITERAADSGGFVATFKWGGIYPYTPEQYVAWLHSWLPQWAATMDYCCEQEITSGQVGIVRSRQDQTTAMAYHFWNEYRNVSWAWVPTIQGWTIDDYVRHAQELKPLIQEMQAYYGTASVFRVGIGTLCHRASVGMIRSVVQAVTAILGNVPIHLWGVKLDIFKSPIGLPEQVISCDSAAFNGLWGKGRTVWKQSGKAQRQWTLEDALPDYSRKLYRAVAFPKMHTSLFDNEDETA